MKKDIHPAYRYIEVSCTCGNHLSVGTVLDQDSLQVEICSQCHPFYTGKQKLVDTSGQVERFRKRFGRRQKSASKLD